MSNRVYFFLFFFSSKMIFKRRRAYQHNVLLILIVANSSEIFFFFFFFFFKSGYQLFTLPFDNYLNDTSYSDGGKDTTSVEDSQVVKKVPQIRQPGNQREKLQKKKK